MKKKITLLVALLIVFSLTFALTSCGGNGNTDTNKSTQSNTKTNYDNDVDDNDSSGKKPTHVHIEEVIAAVAPTCTETGLTEGKKCSVCGEVLVKQEILPIVHSYDGSYECTKCDFVLHTSEGLEFELDTESNTYSIIGIGTCTDTDIVIPYTYEGKAVTSIGDWAFSECNSLTSVTIGNNVTSIGGYAFNVCESLTSISVDEDNTAYKSIDGNLYTKDGTTLIQYAIGKQDTSFVIPNGVTSIGNYAFDGCTSLTSITIPDSVISIGESAFSYCENLTSITIPDSVTSIGESAFHSCSSLTSITIPNGVTSIEGYTFFTCESLTSITIPNSVTSIGSSAFDACRGLTSVIIGNSVTSIESHAFNDCDSLTSVIIPNSVTSMGWAAFGNCDNLTSVAFVDVDGWYGKVWHEIYGNEIAVDLSDASANAIYLKETYYDYYWYKK